MIRDLAALAGRAWDVAVVAVGSMGSAPCARRPVEGSPPAPPAANRGRGNLGRSLLASLAIGAIGWGATLATNQGELMLAVPVLQVATSVIIERATSR